MTTAPTANINGVATDGGFWQKAQDTLLGLFDTGRQIYEGVSGRTLAGDKIVKETVTPPKTVIEEPKTIFGLSQNQALIVAAGLTVVLIISMSRRK